MGEAGEIAKQLNVPVSFSAFKGPDGSLKIMFYEYVEDREKDLDLDGGDSDH
jgi:hypothetical protein